jgi:hypothetical protein
MGVKALQGICFKAWKEVAEDKRRKGKGKLSIGSGLSSLTLLGADIQLGRES